MPYIKHRLSCESRQRWGGGGGGGVGNVLVIMSDRMGILFGDGIDGPYPDWLLCIRLVFYLLVIDRRTSASSAAHIRDVDLKSS